MHDRPPFATRAARALSVRNVSALYLFILLFVTFSILVPETFLSGGVWRSVLDTQALYAIAAIALVIPLAAGVFTLAIGAEVGFAAILVAVLISHAGLPVGLSVALTLVCGAAIGVVTGVLLVRFRIDSLVATLGTSSVLAAATAWASNSQQILGLDPSLQAVATNPLLGVTSATWIMLGAATLVWYVLECTAIGRRVYATGGNAHAARLAGVSTSVVIVGSLAACGALAATAGVLQTARTSAGDPTVGMGYLLPAYAAAMLGATQLRAGRYNVWGAVLAVYVLATGIKGLQLAGAPLWIPDLFNGMALLVAVGVAANQGSRTAGRSTLKKWSESPRWLRLRWR